MRLLVVKNKWNSESIINISDYIISWESKRVMIIPERLVPSRGDARPPPPFAARHGGAERGGDADPSGDSAIYRKAGLLRQE